MKIGCIFGMQIRSANKIDFLHFFMMETFLSALLDVILL